MYASLYKFYCGRCKLIVLVYPPCIINEMDGDDAVTDTDTGNEPMEAFSVSEQHPNGRSSFGRRRHSEHHRRHEFLADRLEAYSDAVFAIVGTILVAYLQQIVPTTDDPGVNIRKLAIDSISLFTVYHFTFFHVTIIWLNHSRVFGIIERVNDVLVWLNMLLLYVVSFVPLTFGVLAEYRDTYHGILVPSVTLVLVNSIMVVIVWYAFKRARFLHIDLPENYCTLVKRIMYSNLLLGPFFAVLAIGLGSVNVVVGQVLFYLSTVMLIVPRLIIYIFWRTRWRELDSELTRALGIYISKERIEFFTDGIYAIVATLVVLDITVDGIPSRELVNKEYDGSLIKALFDRRVEYVAHFTTFLVISLLWFVHHSLFNFVRKLNPLMLVVHLCSCSLIGVIPAVIAVLSNSFDSGSGENEAVSIRLAAMIVVITGILQLVFLSLMYFTDTECVDPIMFHSSASLHLFLKVMVIPVTCTIGYWCSLGSLEFRTYSFYVLYLCSPLTFVVINIAMKSGKLRSLFKYCWEMQSRSRERLQRRLSKSFEAEMEMKNYSSQEGPNEVK